MPTPYALSAASANGLSSDDAQPIELRVNSQRALRVEQTGPSPNILGGYSGNLVSNEANRELSRRLAALEGTVAALASRLEGNE